MALAFSAPGPGCEFCRPGNQFGKPRPFLGAFGPAHSAPVDPQAIGPLGKLARRAVHGNDPPAGIDEHHAQRQAIEHFRRIVALYLQAGNLAIKPHRPLDMGCETAVGLEFIVVEWLAPARPNEPDHGDRIARPHEDVGHDVPHVDVAEHIAKERAFAIFSIREESLAGQDGSLRGIGRNLLYEFDEPEVLMQGLYQLLFYGHRTPRVESARFTIDDEQDTARRPQFIGQGLEDPRQQPNIGYRLVEAADQITQAFFAGHASAVPCHRFKGHPPLFAYDANVSDRSSRTKPATADRHLAAIGGLIADAGQ